MMLIFRLRRLKESGAVQQLQKRWFKAPAGGSGDLSFDPANTFAVFAVLALGTVAAVFVCIIENIIARWVCIITSKKHNNSQSPFK